MFRALTKSPLELKTVASQWQMILIIVLCNSSAIEENVADVIVQYYSSVHSIWCRADIKPLHVRGAMSNSLLINDITLDEYRLRLENQLYLRPRSYRLQRWWCDTRSVGDNGVSLQINDHGLRGTISLLSRLFYLSCYDL